MVRVAAADGGGSLSAGARDREGYTSRGDGVHEGRFAGGCGGGRDDVRRCSGLRVHSLATRAGEELKGSSVIKGRARCSPVAPKSPDPS